MAVVNLNYVAEKLSQVLIIRRSSVRITPPPPTYLQIKYIAALRRVVLNGVQAAFSFSTGAGMATAGHGFVRCGLACFGSGIGLPLHGIPGFGRVRLGEDTQSFYRMGRGEARPWQAMAWCVWVWSGEQWQGPALAGIG